jgi:hypothetical protein
MLHLREPPVEATAQELRRRRGSKSGLAHTPLPKDDAPSFSEPKVIIDV